MRFDQSFQITDVDIPTGSSNIQVKLGWNRNVVLDVQVVKGIFAEKTVVLRVIRFDLDRIPVLAQLDLVQGIYFLRFAGRGALEFADNLNVHLVGIGGRDPDGPAVHFHHEIAAGFGGE